MIDFCGWQNYGLNNWLRTTGGSRGIYDTPVRDANTQTKSGYFIVIPAEYQPSYLGGTIRSPPLTGSTKTRCFSFSYFAHNESVNMDVLQIQIIDLTAGKTILQQNFQSSKSPYWIREKVSIPMPPYRFAITLSTTTFSSPNSDIALDYFVLDDNCEKIEPSTTSTIPPNELKWNCDFDGNCRGWDWDNNWDVTTFHQSKFKC